MEWCIVIAILFVCGAYVVLRTARTWRRLNSTENPGCGDDCPGCTGQGACRRDCHPGKPPGALGLAIAVLGLAIPGGAQPADTIETWAPGATNVDFYLGMEGLGRKTAVRSMGADVMFGYGITEGFSAYLGASMAADGRLQNGSGSLYTGLFGTPLATDHLDLDLLLNFELSGQGYDQLAVAPGVELVYTSHPEMQGWGLYLRGFAQVAGAGSEPDGRRGAVQLALEATLGAFTTLNERHQLLLEVDGAYRPAPGPSELRLQLGGAAVGYNLVLSQSIELINQVFIDLPQSASEPIAVGVMLGFVATLAAS